MKTAEISLATKQSGGSKLFLERDNNRFQIYCDSAHLHDHHHNPLKWLNRNGHDTFFSPLDRRTECFHTSAPPLPRVPRNQDEHTVRHRRDEPTSDTFECSLLFFLN